MLKFIVACAFFFLVNTLEAQHVVEGEVKNASNGQYLTGANVYIPELSKGASTDDAGYYIIDKIPYGKIKVQFSFLGYKTVIKTVQCNQDTMRLDVTLTPTAIHSQEVVISGGVYSTQHENAIKIETIKREDLLQSGSMSFTEALTEVPGVAMISKGLGVAKPVIRGLSETNIIMLNNGVRMENFQFSENHPY